MHDQRYEYRDAGENELDPIATAGVWPRHQDYSLIWYARFLPGFVRSWLNHLSNWVDEKACRLGFRFDLLLAYKRLFPGGVVGRSLPDFVKQADCDEAFAYRRVAGPNPLSLIRAADLQSLLDHLPDFDVDGVEKQLAEDPRYSFRGPLRDYATGGRLFFVDFSDMNSTIPIRIGKPSQWQRDSRWRAKYFATPIAAFLEIEITPQGTAGPPSAKIERRLVPLAIQIEPGCRIAYPPRLPRPDQGWEWRIAKHYFESADVSFHEAIGHAYRSHLVLEPFAMATPRQLPRDHPVHTLLEPHLRFTLRSNRDAYRYSTDRKRTYARFYSGTLECQRNLMKKASRDRSFHELAIDTDLLLRGVGNTPEDYPYRDDARLWLPVIERFVQGYVDRFFESDDAVAGDPNLQDWVEELRDPNRGALSGVVPGDRLDSRRKLVDLLTQVLFIAGPGHAAQHYSSAYYYRYSPAFPAAAWSSPPVEPKIGSQARNEYRASYDAALPPIGAARLQFTYSSFLDFRYDTFGDYRKYALGRSKEAAGLIDSLQDDLLGIEREIETREARRPLVYNFLRPSKVPNSVTI